MRTRNRNSDIFIRQRGQSREKCNKKLSWHTLEAPKWRRAAVFILLYLSFPFCPWRQSKIWFLRMRNCFSLLFVWLERESHQKPQLTLATLHPSIPSWLPSPAPPWLRHCTAFGAILKIQGKYAATYFFCTMSSRGLRFYFVRFFLFAFSFFAVFHIFFYFPCVFFLWLPFALAFFTRRISGFYFLCRRRLLLA